MFFIRWFGLALFVSIFLLFLSPIIYFILAMIFSVVAQSIVVTQASGVTEVIGFVLFIMFVLIPFGLIVGSFIALAQKQYVLPQRHHPVWHDWVSKSAITSAIGACLSSLIGHYVNVYYLIPLDPDAPFGVVPFLWIAAPLTGVIIGSSFGQYWVLRRILRHSWLWVIAHFVLGFVFFYQVTFGMHLCFLTPITPGLITAIAMIFLFHINHLPLDEGVDKKDKVPA